MRTSWKLPILLTLLMMIYAGFGYIMEWQLSHFAHLVKDLHERPMAVTRAALTASRDIIAISRNSKDMVLVSDQQRRRNRLIEIEQYEASIKSNIQLVFDRIEGEEGKELAKTAMKQVDDQRDLRLRLTKALALGNIQEANRLTEVEGTALMKKIEQTMGNIVDYSDTRGMQYHAESIDDLRNAKIILFSAGLIMVIFSVLFVLFMSGLVFRSLAKTKKSLVLATDGILDLSLRLPTPSVGDINQVVNDLVAESGRRFFDIKTKVSRIDQELLASYHVSDQLNTSLDSVALLIEPSTKELNTIAHKELVHTASLKILGDLLGQIKAELALLAQLSSKDQQGSMRENLIHCIQSLENMRDLFVAVEHHNKVVIAIAHKQIEVFTRLDEFKKMIAALKEGQDVVRDGISSLHKTLQSIKVD
jgi:hypothetical protein